MQRKKILPQINKLLFLLIEEEDILSTEYLLLGPIIRGVYCF